MPQVIAHVDMDCFFAACEYKRNPKLKGKPLIVGASKDAPRGVVSTASYEARKFGVHSAMPVAIAARKCPQGIFIRGDMDYYQSESRKVMQVLARFADEFSQGSVDEAHLNVTRKVQEYGDWMTFARAVRKAVFDETQYTCSIGISNSAVVSKIASGFKKPHGITVVYNSKKFLEPMPIGKIPGIGKKSEPQYLNHGIGTIGQLAKTDIFYVMEHFGRGTAAFWHLANGNDATGISSYGIEKSISRETTFMTDVDDSNTLRESLVELCKDVFDDSKNFLFRNVSIKVRYPDFSTITRSHSLSFAISDYDSMKNTVLNLFAQHVPACAPVRLIGVRVAQLEPNEHQQMTLCAYA